MCIRRFAAPLLALAVLLTCVRPLAAQSAGDHYVTSADVLAALTASRALVAAHPHSARARIDLAYTLMDVALGQEAIEQGRLATEAEPTSAFAFSAYGWLLHHNALGQDYGKGYDYEGSLAAYRRAIELDPADLGVRQSLSDNLRYDPDGVEYGPKANLDQAIQILTYVQAHQHPVEPDTVNNLAIELLYTSRFEDVLTEARQHAATPTLDGAALAALAAEHGSAQAIAEADKLTGDTQRRNNALDTAASGLWTLRRYAAAADLLAAENPADAPTLAKVQLFRTLKPFQPATLDVSDPRTPVELLLYGLLSGSLTEASLNDLYVHSVASKAPGRRANQNSLAMLRGMSESITAQTHLSPAVISDIVLSRVELQVQPDLPTPLAVVRLTLFGRTGGQIVLLREQERYRIVSTDREPAALGEEALALLRDGRQETAASLLDVARAMLPHTADDPLARGGFALLWHTGGQRDASTITMAAAALDPDSPSAVPLLPVLRARAAELQGDQRAGLFMTLVQIDLAQHDAHAAAADSSTLLGLYPESMTAVRLRGRSLALNKDWQGWREMLVAQLKTHPDRLDLRREQIVEQASEARFDGALEASRAVLQSGHATPADHNQYAWVSLLAGQLDQSADHEAQQATLNVNTGFAELHTLACLQAAEGHAQDARQTLERAMIAGHLAEPDGAVWLAYGLLYESYGERAAAIKAYSQVSAPAGVDDPLSSYALAQRHLSALAPPQHR